MPVYAEINYRKISVSASYRQIHATARMPVAAVVIQQTEPVTEISFQRPFTEVGYRLLTPELTWRQLFATNIGLNPERTIYTFADAFSLSETVSLNPNLGQFDSFGFSDQIDSFAFILGKSDPVSFSEHVIREFERPTLDTVTFADNSVFNINAGRSDEVTFSDSIATLKTFQRAFADTFPFSDPLSWSLSDVSDDTFSFSEQTSRVTARVNTDSFAFSDTVVRAFEKIPSETISLSESALVVDVGDINFVLSGENWVISAPFSDASPLTESSTFAISQALSDAFTLDDFAQVDKNYSGVKTNVYALSEVLSFGFQKGIQDSIIQSDSVAKSLTYGGFTHDFSFADSATISTGKVPSDTLSMAETLSMAQFSGSGVLNQGMVGLMLLNAD